LQRKAGYGKLQQKQHEEQEFLKHKKLQVKPMISHSDKEGAYTGTPDMDGDVVPVQDADDL